MNYIRQLTYVLKNDKLHPEKAPGRAVREITPIFQKAGQPDEAND